MRWPASALLASILLIVITIQGAAENQGQWGRVRLNYTGSVDTRDQCPRLRIGIINGVNFHFEVLSGLIHLLQPYERHIDVFLSPYARTANFDGAWELVKWSRCTFRRTDAHEHPGRLPSQPYDLVILVSPDYEIPINQALIRAMNAKRVIALVHNADYNDMGSLLGIFPNMDLLSLSPHVANALAKNTNRQTDWMLSVYPVPLERDCTATLPDNQVLGLCLRGFALQGKFSNLRRNYSSIWRQMTTRLPQINDPQVSKVFHVHVLGKGPDRLNLPPELTQHVTVHRRLQYRPFYAAISKVIALLPSLADERYFTAKFSSTIMTSLQTGVPVLATERMLKSYSFLKREAVFMQQEGEEELDAMLRISRMPAADIMQTRRALARLREELNQRSFGMLEKFVKEACAANGGGKGSGGEDDAGGSRRRKRRKLKPQ